MNRKIVEAPLPWCDVLRYSKACKPFSQNIILSALLYFGAILANRRRAYISSPKAHFDQNLYRMNRQTLDIII